jgi:hypothetical protein
MKMTKDEHEGYKVVFMAIVADYLDKPTTKKREKLSKIVVETLQKDPHLLTWFNTMFWWENTDEGINLTYRHKIPKIPS